MLCEALSAETLCALVLSVQTNPAVKIAAPIAVNGCFDETYSAFMG